jgi:hypothetical protein
MTASSSCELLATRKLEGTAKTPRAPRFAKGIFYLRPAGKSPGPADAIAIEGVSRGKLCIVLPRYNEIISREGYQWNVRRIATKDGRTQATCVSAWRRRGCIGAFGRPEIPHARTNLKPRTFPRGALNPLPKPVHARPASNSRGQADSSGKTPIKLLGESWRPWRLGVVRKNSSGRSTLPDSRGLRGARQVAVT